jgi:hypothetical protein
MILLELTASEWIAIWGIAGGIFISVIGSAIFLIFRTGRIVEAIASMQETLKDVPKIKYSFGQMTVKVDTLWRNHLSKSNSPVILNEIGIKVLESSKISEFTDFYYVEILEKVKGKNPLNPYQAQESLIQIVSEYQNMEECKLKLQEAAFNSGYDINSVLYVAAINIRDKIISDLGFKVEDIDKHDPKNNPVSK